MAFHSGPEGVVMKLALVRISLSLALTFAAATAAADTLVIANKGEDTASLIDLESGRLTADREPDGMGCSTKDAAKR